MKIAAAIRTLASAAAQHDGTVEDDSVGLYVNLQVCAPEGKVWVDSDGEHLVVSTARGPQSWLDDAVADALQRIAQGTKDAPEDDE